MTFTEMEQAVEDARRTRLLADAHITQMIRICLGRLRSVSDWSERQLFIQLKRELAQFNSRTRKFKGE